MDSYAEKWNKEKHDELNQLVERSKRTTIRTFGGIDVKKSKRCRCYAKEVIDLFFDEVGYLYMLIERIKGRELYNLYDFPCSDMYAIVLLETYGPIDLKKYRMMKNIVFTILRYSDSIGKFDLKESHDIVFGRSLISMMKMFNVISLTSIFAEAMKHFLLTDDDTHMKIYKFFNADEFPIIDEYKETDPLKIEINKREQANTRYRELEKLYGFRD